MRAAILALVLLVAPAAAADVRIIESLGAVPLDPSGTSSTPPRDEALRTAIFEAVRRVALDEVAGSATREPEIDAALGEDPFVFASRYRIVEDRGSRPALFTAGGPGAREYVVVAEVHVDADRVRQRLARAGLVARPSGDAGRYRVRLVLEQLGSYGSFRAVQTVLEELGVRSALPIELERGRAVLLVDGHLDPERLVDALVRAAPPNLSLVPLSRDGDTVRMRARFAGTPAGASPAAHDEPFDTPKRNRY